MSIPAANVSGSKSLRLLINVDHAATLRNVREPGFFDPLEVARHAVAAGADGITVHLREDRRHIRDEDVRAIAAADDLGMMCLEMALVDEMVEIACETKPDRVCIVPEKRAELTTEGGLSVAAMGGALSAAVAKLNQHGITTSVFVDAEESAISEAARCGAHAVEIHTGVWADSVAMGKPDLSLIAAIDKAANFARRKGLEVHAGHGLTFESLPRITAMKAVSEISIGHFVICQSVISGIGNVVRRLRSSISETRDSGTYSNIQSLVTSSE